MKKQLIYLLGKYGVDFFAKCPLYKTAIWKNNHVALIAWEPNTLEYKIRTISGLTTKVSVFSLDRFVL